MHLFKFKFVTNICFTKLINYTDSKITFSEYISPYVELILFKIYFHFAFCFSHCKIPSDLLQLVYVCFPFDVSVWPFDLAAPGQKALFLYLLVCLVIFSGLMTSIAEYEKCLAASSSHWAAHRWAYREICIDSCAVAIYMRSPCVKYLTICTLFIRLS